MKHRTHIAAAFVLVLLFSIAFPMAACANSAEPPSFTVIVSEPPEDLSLTLRFADGAQTEAVVLRKEQKAWETYYRFFYHMSPSSFSGKQKLDGAVLVIQSGEGSFQCALPSAAFQTYNNLLTLQLETESLTIGQPAFRVPLLVAMRVVLTLLIEGAVFFLFGYRKKQSWLAFFIINILTQGGLNVMLTGPGVGSYWWLGFLLGEIVVLAVELIAFVRLVKEFRKRRVVVYTIAANAASLLLGGLLLAYLPV